MYPATIRLRILALAALALLTAAAVYTQSPAQSPTGGHIAGNAYLNGYFHIAYTWPGILKPLPLPSAAQDSTPSQYAFALFSARQGDQPYGVVVSAEKLNVAGPHSTGLKTSAEFIDRLANSLRPGPVLSNITRSEKKNAQGMTFSELDFLMNGQPSSTIATQVGGYLLVFKCNAKSAAEIAQIKNSVFAMRLTK
jgi:hypothetical protein